MKTAYLPTYTQVSKTPLTICEKLPAEVFDSPFYNDSVPHFRLQNSSRKELKISRENDSEKSELLQLKGFIFHTSHCGSTLLANMLKASKKTRIISETEAINGLLLSAVFYNLEERELLKNLKAIIEAYLQPLGEAEKVVFKLTSWNIFFISLFQKAYPDIPWIYIDRKTENVVQSLLKSGRGFVEWWHHPTDLLRKYFLGENEIPQTLEKYLFKMVESHRAASLKAIPKNKLVLEYPNFIDDFESKILPHLNLKYTEAALKVAKAITKVDSKSLSKSAFSPRENHI